MKIVSVCSCLFAAVAACGSAEEPGNATPKHAGPVVAESGNDASTPRSATSLSPVLEHYEAIRSLLADDDASIAASAKALAEAASRLEAKGGTSEPGASALDSATKQLLDVTPGDLEAARVGFGEVSKALIDLIAAHPDMQSRYHVFECPMARPYNKWVQSDAKLANPYMGSEMLACGSESEWAS